MEDTTWKIMGTEIKRLREFAGLSQRQLASRAGYAANTISSWECGLRRPSLDVVRALDRTLGSGEELAQTWARLRGRRELPSEWLDLAEVESLAVEIREYNPVVLPGVVQTEDYAYALLMAPRWYSRDRARELAQERAERLDRLSDTDITIITRESVLRSVIGSPDVMRGQLKHLLTVSQRERVRLLAVPSDAWGAPVPASGFGLLVLSDGRSLVRADSAMSDHVVSDTTGVRVAGTLINDIAGYAASPDNTRTMIEGLFNAI